MPRSLLFGIIVVLVLALIPPAIIIWARSTQSRKPRIHLVQDMDNQHRLRAQSTSQLFADGRGMRPDVPNSIAQGELRNDAHLYDGVVNKQWAESFPEQTPVTRRFVERGRERYNIFCSVCHGHSGYGDGMVHRRAMLLMEGGINGTTWVAPKSLHDPTIRQQPPGQLYNTITNGIRTMPSYGSQIPVKDRWAIVAYIKALQKSRNAETDDLPDDLERRADELPTETVQPPAGEQGGQQEASQQSQSNAGEGQS